MSPTNRMSSHFRSDSKSGPHLRASSQTPRLVLHNDAESDEESSQEAEIVELPPQYKPSRKSLLLMQDSNTSPSPPRPPDG